MLLQFHAGYSVPLDIGKRRLSFEEDEKINEAQISLRMTKDRNGELLRE